MPWAGFSSEGVLAGRIPDWFVLTGRVLDLGRKERGRSGVALTFDTAWSTFRKHNESPLQLERHGR